MLIDIPFEKIANLVAVLETELPRSLFIINFITTCHKWKLQNNELKIFLLYTDNSMKTGVVIGVVVSGCQGPLVAAYALDSYENALVQALHHLPIHVQKIRAFEGIVEKHAPLVEQFIADQSMKIIRSKNWILFYSPIEEALSLKINCPDDVQLKPLREHNLDEIYNVWGLRDVFTKDHLKNCLKYNDGSAHGIFSKTTDELLARCLRSHAGMVTALQTVAKARNKGYAKLLLKYVTKKIAESGILPCIYTSDYHVVSFNVFRAAGYREACRMRFYLVGRD